MQFIVPIRSFLKALDRKSNVVLVLDYSSKEDQFTTMGRIRRLLQKERPAFIPTDLVCPLCERKIPPSQRDAHHLVPKSKGGRHTEYLHRICHRQIHALLTETELAKQFNSVDTLLAHPDIAVFVAWVKTKPDEFMERTRKSQRLKAA